MPRSIEDGAGGSASATVKVWDLPTRLFHWSLVALIAFSWWSAEYHYEPWHMWSGYAVLFLILFRLLWGLFGSSTARFGKFVKGPRGVMDYLHRASQWRTVGHTPLGGLSVVALLLLIAGQLFFGLILVDEDGLYEGPLSKLVDLETADIARMIHEQLFNVLLGFIFLHIAAILFYRFIRGKRLTRAMIRGTAEMPAGSEPMVASSRPRLIACVAAAFGLTAWIVAGAPPF